MKGVWEAFLLAILCLQFLLAAPFQSEERRAVTDTPMILSGRVYCDTCRAGFETFATTYMPGAKVRVECRSKDTQEIILSKDATTDSTGTYKIEINDDHAGEVCDVMLISSSQDDCASPDPRRGRSRVSLTANNGMSSTDRFANNLGFLRNQALHGCDKVLQRYEEPDD